jgi:hypothetical protein
MSKTNTLTSHHPERSSRRIDKMSNNKYIHWVGFSKKFWKKFSNKKMRQLLKQNNEEKI